jgi:uncharacterized secreted repeat protein (TIGR03808 family)
LDRRAFLASALGAAAATPALAAVGSESEPKLRGTLGEGDLAIDPNSRSSSIQDLLDAASAENRQLFLPPGDFVVSELRLPPRTRLAGVPGATRLLFGGGRFMAMGERCEIVELAGLTFEGGTLPFDEFVPGLLTLTDCAAVSIDNCTILGSTGSGLAADRSAGRIARTTVSGARGVGIRLIEARGMTITDNTVSDCASGGIYVHRWNPADDETVVTGNRVSRIAATDGGSGYNGNGISIFRAHGVAVTNNRIADCAFAAIRANSASNVQIGGNSCTRSGEFGIVSEFAFEGASIANNIVDGAASGIAVLNFAQSGRMAVVSGNIVRNISGRAPRVLDPQRFGAGIVVEADASVTGNVIDGATLHGMSVGWGASLRDVAVTGNVIRRAPVGVAVSVVEGAGAAVIADNLISGAENGAVVGMAYAEPATGDLAETGAHAYPHLLVERNRVS